jgi:hypothetical protein
MKPMRSVQQQIEQLDYIGDMVRQLARMASEDDQNLLTYILNTAAFEVEDQKRIKSRSLASNDDGSSNVLGDGSDNAARTALNAASQFKL